jgi:hypothetical protein
MSGTQAANSLHQTSAHSRGITYTFVGVIVSPRPASESSGSFFRRGVRSFDHLVGAQEK